MNREKIIFAVGLGVGILLAVLFLLFFAPRYATLTRGDTVIKQDTWSGRSWRLTGGGSWEEVREAGNRQEQIDRELRKALTVVIDQNRVREATGRFKEMFPALREIPDEELLARMSALYSTEIMSAIFLENYQRSLQEKAKEFMPQPESTGKGTK
jgi:hypothetical protein